MGKTLYSTGPTGECYRVEVPDGLLTDALAVRDVLAAREDPRAVVEGVAAAGLDGELVAYGVGGERGYGEGVGFVEPDHPFGPVYAVVVEDGTAEDVESFVDSVADGDWERTVYYLRTALADARWSVVGDGEVEYVDGPALYVRGDAVAVVLEWLDGLERLSARPSQLDDEGEGRYACLSDHPDTWFSPKFRRTSTREHVDATDLAAWDALDGT